MFNIQTTARHVRQFWVVVALFSIAMHSAPASAQHSKTTPVIDDYFKMVFSGDVHDAAELFTSNPDDHGSKMLSDGFKRRFVERSDGLDLSSIDSLAVREIMEMFQTYWRDALMQVAPMEQLETELKAELDRMLIENGFSSALDDEDVLLENVTALIQKEGYFALSGRTPPLLELMIWTENDVVTEMVELTDGSYEVDVNYLDDFVSYGWSNFATYGMTSTGGWATKEGLFCLCGHYDLESERFKLSFLKHETRHFADFKRYPELQPSDLEYRGKLTELAFSETEIYGLLTHFFNSANRIENAPHPLANWYVVDGLAKQLLDGEWPSDATAWESVPKKAIREAARRLLDEHDSTLAELGAKTTVGVINF